MTKKILCGILIALSLGLTMLALSVPRANACRRLTGDVNKDGKVNIKDLYTAGLAFGSSIGDPLWNPNADINCDGKIDCNDLYLITIHFGQSFRCN
jgi:hypothetical protein